MKLFQRFYCDQFGKKMFHLTTQRNSKGKRSDFLVCLTFVYDLLHGNMAVLQPNVTTFTWDVWN